MRFDSFYTFVSFYNATEVPPWVCNRGGFAFVTLKAYDTTSTRRARWVASPTGHLRSRGARASLIRSYLPTMGRLWVIQNRRWRKEKPKTLSGCAL